MEIKKKMVGNHQKDVRDVLPYSYFSNFLMHLMLGVLASGLRDDILQTPLGSSKWITFDKVLKADERS